MAAPVPHARAQVALATLLSLPAPLLAADTSAPAAVADPPPLMSGYRSRLQAREEFRDLGGSGVRRTFILRGDYALTDRILLRTDLPFRDSPPGETVAPSDLQLGDLLFKASWRALNRPEVAVELGLELSVRSEFGHRLSSDQNQYAPELNVSVPLVAPLRLDLGARYVQSVGRDDGYTLWRPRAALVAPLGKWYLELATDGYVDRRHDAPRRADTMTVEAEAGYRLPDSWYVWVRGGVRTHGDQAYRSRAEVGVRRLFR